MAAACLNSCVYVRRGMGLVSWTALCHPRAAPTIRGEGQISSMAREQCHMRVVDPVAFFVWFFPCLMIAIIYFGFRAMRPRPDDHREIEHQMKARGLRTISVTRTDNYLGYWEQLGLRSPGSTGRIYVAIGEESPGLLREIHLWFDDWRWYGGGPRILLDRQRPSLEEHGAGGTPSA